MPQAVTILILGLDPIGVSIGLALRRSGGNYLRLGYDPQPKTAQLAQQAGAIDRAVSRPEGGAAEADLVLLNLGPSRAAEAAQAVGGNLRPDTVVLGTFRLQAAMMEDVRARLQASHPYLAAVPFVGPERALAEAEAAPDAATFDGGMLGIVVPAGTPRGAIDIALDLAAILRAKPLFLEPAELDSVTATSDQLPALTAAAVMESLSANPGWRDQRGLVGRPFARLAGLIESAPPGELTEEWGANRTALIARIEALVEELSQLRDLLRGADDEALERHLTQAAGRYQEWRAWRSQALPDLGVELPGVPGFNMVERLLGRRFSSKKS